MLIDTVIEENKLQGVYAYQNDINVPRDSFDGIIHKLQILVTILQKYNRTLSPADCKFQQTAIDSLGFHIEDHTIQSITPKKTKIKSFATYI